MRVLRDYYNLCCGPKNYGRKYLHKCKEEAGFGIYLVKIS